MKGFKKEKKPKGISEQIIFQIGRVVLIVMVIVAIIAVVVVQQLVTKANKSELTLESEAASYQIAGFFEKYAAMAEALAVNPQIEELLESTTAGESLLDEQGYPTVFDNMLSIAEGDKENIMAAWIADKDANMVTQSDKFTSGEDWEITERAWYSVIETGETLLTKPYVDASTGQTILSAVAAVRDSGGKAIGVAGFDISLENIMKIMPQYKIGNSGYVMLLTSDGTFIYHPDEEIIQQNIGDIEISENVVKATQSEETTFLGYKALGAKKYGCVTHAGDTGYVIISCMSSGEYYSQLYIVFAMVVVAFAAGMAAIYLIMKKVAAKITKPILELNGTAQELAKGNLHVDIHVHSDDEIGQLAQSIQATVTRLKEYINYIDEISSVLDQMADGKLAIQLVYDYAGEFEKVKVALLNISDSMKTVMEGITESAEQVAAGADELAYASQGLAEGASTQAAAVEELVATTLTVAEQVEENKQDAVNCVKEAEHATDIIEESQIHMNQMMEAMRNIQETSQKVVGIIATIEEIADQTNLLSLNASIEAARAGEAGKGFAVVAGEIGSLADESAKAANNTRELISLSMNEIQKGNNMAEEVLQSLRISVEAINKVNGMVEKTTENATYQASNMEQIRAGIEEISEAIQDNSAMAEESSATSEELSAQATSLNELVQRFQLS